MNELHLFAGAGGGILGGMLLGHRCIGAVEISPYCRAVIAARQADGTLPPFPVFTDIRTFDARPYAGRADVVAGGFPCQPFSSAARGRSVAPDLWPCMRQVVADARPAFVFAENVSRQAIEQSAGDLRALGYTSKAIPLSAQDVGADHIRQRYWLLAHADSDGELFGAEHAEVGVLPVVQRGLWSAEPRCIRVSDGVAGWVDRLSAAGNGQVPVVAAAAFAMLAAEFNRSVA